MPGAPSSLQHLKMNLQGVLVAPFLTPTFITLCFFFMNKIKQ